MCVEASTVLRAVAADLITFNKTQVKSIVVLDATDLCLPLAFTLVSLAAYYSILTMEAIFSLET
jgi:hypothetical protein